MMLRTKITILTTVIAVSVVFFTLLPIRGVVINAFRGELEKKAVSITTNLSDRIANSIVLKDYFQTTKAFNEVLDKEKDIEYIFATNEDGKIFAHTFENGTPPGLLTWNPLPVLRSSTATEDGSGETRNIQLLDTEAGYIRDVGISVFPGTRSELHIGIREEGLKQTLLKMRYMTIPIIIIVIFIGFIASYIFSRLVTEPLNKFVEFTKVLGKGNFGERVDVPYGDEIGYLARNFNRLSMQLKTTKENMEEAYTYTHLLQAEKLSSIGQISAGLAHELKNPMTTLKMLFQAYKEQPDMTIEDAEVISNEIERIDNILTNFMGFVKQKEFKMAEVDLNALLARVLSLATYDIEHGGITVHEEIIEALPPVKADRSLLEHVFLNLIMNSIQAMPEGGDIRISGRSEDDFVEVMVWDKGSGIPSDIRSKIFDPFFTTKEQGTGLGLSIAYNIVKSHGGKLFFNSTEGKGTVFTVKLPKGEVNE